MKQEPYRVICLGHFQHSSVTELDHPQNEIEEMFFYMARIKVLFSEAVPHLHHTAMFKSPPCPYVINCNLTLKWGRSVHTVEFVFLTWCSVLSL